MNKIILILCVLLCNGCGLVAVKKDIKLHHDIKISITIEDNYEKVYNDYMELIYRSPNMVWIGDQRIIDNVISINEKTAYIRICRVNAVGGEYMQSRRDIKALTDLKTQMDLYYCRVGIFEDMKKSKEIIIKDLKKMYKTCKVL